jgi:hypothetical protein
MLQLREFPGGHNAANIKAQLLGAGFDPHGVRLSSHLSDSAAPYAVWRAEKHEGAAMTESKSLKREIRRNYW